MPVSRSLVMRPSQSRSESPNWRRPLASLATGPSSPMRSYQRSVCWDSPHFSAASLMLQVVTLTSLRVRVRSNANGPGRVAASGVAEGAPAQQAAEADDPQARQPVGDAKRPRADPAAGDGGGHRQQGV